MSSFLPQEIEAATQRDMFLAEVRPPDVSRVYSNRCRQVMDDHHTCGICLRRRGSYEHARTTMPACGCVFHSSCVRSLARRARYRVTPSTVAVMCLCGTRNDIAEIPAVATRGAEPLPRCLSNLTDAGFDSDRIGPLEGIQSYARRWTDGGTLALNHLERDIAGAQYPPFVPGLAWDAWVRHYRSLPESERNRRASAGRLVRVGKRNV